MREQIQSKLEEITSIETSAEVPDDLLQSGVTYFSYSLQQDFDASNYDKNYTYRYAITGYLKRRDNLEENTIAILDTAKDLILEKLKDLNIRGSATELPAIDGIRKLRITGYVYYDELTNNLR